MVKAYPWEQDATMISIWHPSKFTFKEIIIIPTITYTNIKPVSCTCRKLHKQKILLIILFHCHKTQEQLGQIIQEWAKKNLWKTAFKKFEKVWSAQAYSFKFFKGCLPHILLGPFLNTLSHITN